jgi:hypothetical protein
MNDTLRYISLDPVHRKYHHNQLTFRLIYAFQENFVLPLSHDEVVHGKSSILGRMPGDLWQKFANLRLLLAYQYAQPGKKLLFMGSEFGQWSEWSHDGSLDWHLTELSSHHDVQRWVADLNRTYRREPALYELDCDHNGFEWIDCNDADQSMLSFLRKPADGNESDSRCSQLHAGTSPWLSRRRAVGRRVERDLKQRCEALRRRRFWQPRQDGGRTHADARPTSLRHTDSSTAGCNLSERDYCGSDPKIERIS